MAVQQNLHLKSDWTSDQKILRYMIYSANTEMMQQWRESVLYNLRHWPPQSSPRVLFDLSYPNVSMSYFVLSHRELFNLGITAEGKEDFLAFLDNNAETETKLAVVLSNTMLGALSNYIPTDYGRHNFTPRIFFNRETAEEWLRVEMHGSMDSFKTNAITSETLLQVMQDLDVNQQDIYGDRDYLRILVNESLETVPIVDGQPIIVGRSADVDIDLSGFGQLARSVSRRHAQISLSNGRLSIIDLNSRNGTFVLGQRIPPGKTVFIRRDDTIKVGSIEFSIMF